MKTKIILSVITALLFNVVAGLAAASVFEIQPLPAVGGAVTLGILRSFVPLPQGILQAGLLKEIWISQLMENFYSNITFLSRSQDMNEFVQNNTINLADAGVDPNVLINNTTYPIPMSERTDTPLALPLDYFDTENTVVRNAEAVQLAYNKLESVIRQHRNALIEKCSAKAAHAYGPSADSANTPVFASTGANRGDGAKALTLKDIATMQEKFDLLKVSDMGRVMVLSPKHRTDILNEDKALFKAFTNLKAGEVLPLCGFDVYWTQLTPKYNKVTGAKVAFGAAPLSTDTHSTLFYHEAEVMRADGTVEMFERLRDPEARGDIVGFQKRFLGMPIRNKFIGAIFSPDAV